MYDELQGDNGYGIRINLYYPFDSDEGMVSGTLIMVAGVLAVTSCYYQIPNYEIRFFNCTGDWKKQIFVLNRSLKWITIQKDPSLIKKN